MQGRADWGSILLNREANHSTMLPLAFPFPDAELCVELIPHAQFSAGRCAANAARARHSWVRTGGGPLGMMGRDRGKCSAYVLQ